MMVDFVKIEKIARLTADAKFWAEYFEAQRGTTTEGSHSRFRHFYDADRACLEILLDGDVKRTNELIEVHFQEIQQTTGGIFSNDGS